jgi:hypothetical protein
MSKLVGKRWGELSEEKRDDLLTFANCVDGETGDQAREGECIVDLTDTLSIAGFLTDEGDIVIDNEAVIYSPIA